MIGPGAYRPRGGQGVQIGSPTHRPSCAQPLLHPGWASGERCRPKECLSNDASHLRSQTRVRSSRCTKPPPVRCKHAWFLVAQANSPPLGSSRAVGPGRPVFAVLAGAKSKPQFWCLSPEPMRISSPAFPLVSVSTPPRQSARLSSFSLFECDPACSSSAESELYYTVPRNTVCCPPRRQSCKVALSPFPVTGPGDNARASYPCVLLGFSLLVQSRQARKKPREKTERRRCSWSR